jgi:hypothetical protein
MYASQVVFNHQQEMTMKVDELTIFNHLLQGIAYFVENIYPSIDDSRLCRKTFEKSHQI